MSGQVIPDTAATLPPDTASAPVVDIPPAPEPLTDDELATKQAGTTDPVPEAADTLLFNDHDKAIARANIRWLMAELDWARSGRTVEEREILNP